MRRLVTILIALAMIVPAVTVVAGGKKEAGAAAQTELRMAWWGSQRRHDMTIGAIELYMQKNPNVTITYEFAGWGDYWTMLTTQAAGGNLPDIVQHDYQYLAEWAGRGQLLGLNRFVDSGLLDMSDVEEDAIAGGRLEGELYGVNIGSNGTTFVIDVDMFEAAGIPIPDWEWTWQDFERIAGRLHDELGVWAIGGNLQNWHIWNQIYISLGQSAYARDGQGLGYTDDQPFIDHLRMLVRLQDAGVVPHISEWLAVYDEAGVEQQPIVAGDAAMAFVWSNQLIAMWRAAGEDRNFVLRPVPRVAGRASSVYVKPGQFLAVSARTGNPEAAVSFLNAWTNDVEMNRILSAERGVPISSVVANDLYGRISAAERPVFDYVIEVAQRGSPLPAPDPAGHSELEDNVFIAEVTEPVLFGRRTPEEGVRILRREAPGILQAASR